MRRKHNRRTCEWNYEIFKQNIAMDLTNGSWKDYISPGKMEFKFHDGTEEASRTKGHVEKELKRLLNKLLCRTHVDV